MPVDPTSINWDDCALERITEMVSRRVHVDRQTGTVVVQTHLRKGALVPQHTHNGEQLIQVTLGSVVVTFSGLTLPVRTGESLTIPGGAPHQIEALDDSVVVDVRHGEVMF